MQYERQKWFDTFGLKLSWLRQEYWVAANNSKHGPGLSTSDREQHRLANKEAYSISARLAARGLPPYGPDHSSFATLTDLKSAATDQIYKFTQDLTGVKGVRMLSYCSFSHGLQI